MEIVQRMRRHLPVTIIVIRGSVREVGNDNQIVINKTDDDQELMCMCGNCDQEVVDRMHCNYCCKDHKDLQEHWLRDMTCQQRQRERREFLRENARRPLHNLTPENNENLPPLPPYEQ